MLMKKRVGILGCGVITQRTLPGLETTLEDYGCQLTGVFDPNESSMSNIQRLSRFDSVTAHQSYDEMRADSDMIFIATPIALHYDQVKQALQDGCHVYTHKTLASSSAQCLELAGLAESQNLTLAASPGQILVPAYRRARELIQDGHIGDVVSIDAATEAAPHRYELERAQENPGEGQSFSWEWYHRQNAGGGPLDDMFVYPLAFLTELLGPVTGANIHSRLMVPEIRWKGRKITADTPDSYAGVIQFDQVPITMRASFSANSSRVPWGMISIRGTQACLEIEKRNDLEYFLYVTPNGGEPVVEEHPVFEPTQADRFGSAECHVLTDMREFVTAVQEQRPLRGATPANAALVADGLSQIKQSSLTSRGS